MLWDAFGSWIQHRKVDRDSSFMHGGIAVVLEQLPFNAPNLILYFASTPIHHRVVTDTWQWVQDSGSGSSTYVAIGQTDNRAIVAQLQIPRESKWLDDWTHARQKMLISPEPSSSPNILFLDAEERRWVTPNNGVGEIRSESLNQRWLSSYQATNNWDGQVESALLNMKVSSEKRFNNLVDDMNRFLSGKKILKKVKIGENRLHVQLDNQSTHSIDKLSAGERQVLILLYMVDRWLENGGIALIDEPDLYLHPSLISGFLAQLEKMISERDGQLIITSHIPEVWERYETLGKRAQLGASE